jgi:hypothetical protein
MEEAIKQNGIMGPNAQSNVAISVNNQLAAVTVSGA